MSVTSALNRRPRSGSGDTDEEDGAARVGDIQATLCDLVEQVAAQAARQVKLERHVADLGKVLGELGVDVSDRLRRLERAGGVGTVKD